MIYKYKNEKPNVDVSAFVADQSSVIGKVTIKANCGIWFGAVLRGDVNTIYIGEGTNVQDNTTVHVAGNAKTVVGNGVTIGHNCIIHGCEIGDSSLIGMGSTILDHSVIGKRSIVGAGSLVTMNKVFPDDVLIMGSPAKVIRALTEEEKLSLEKSAQHYIEIAKEYK